MANNVAKRNSSMLLPTAICQSRFVVVAVVLTVLGACAPTIRQPMPITRPDEVRGAAVARTPIPSETTQPALAPTPVLPPTASPNLVVNVPAGTQYVCVNFVDAEVRQTAIAFAPKVAALCRTHPEMGPCQYEREVCRRSGGRVFTADRVEITRATEAEYDKKVIRVRLRAD